MVRALQYVTISRLDITFIVNKVCQFMHSATILKAPTILVYASHPSRDITIHAYGDEKSPLLTAFSDADWVGCPDDRRSTRGYGIYLGMNLVSWSASKQKTVSRSSTEAEYKALANTITNIT